MAKTQPSTYTPDDDIKLHNENAIKLICQPYQNHESGLAEWPKNAADEYVRTEAPEDERVIVLIMQNGRAHGPSNVIGCLDFSGMTSATIENDFRHWADPEAARRGGDDINVQGGHGNGGKCYMTQMFEDRAYLYTVKGGLGNVYGTAGGSIKLGYFPDRKRGKDFAVMNVKEELGKALGEIGLNVGDLPSAARTALEKRKGFTLVVGRGAKGYNPRVPAVQLLGDLIEHTQMRRTLEMCSVYAVVQRKLYNQGKPLKLPEIPPLPGAEEPRVIAIPETLVDPVSGSEVSTTIAGAYPEGTLTLRTSETRMFRRRARHIISYKAKSGYIGYKPVTEFDVSSSYRERIYGECQLMALESAKLNDRAALATSPLVRAVENWISEEIEKYAKEFEARDRRKQDQEEKDALAQINAALDTWKNKLLDKVFGGAEGSGEDTGDYRPSPSPSPPRGEVARIELSLTYYRAGVGVAMQPKLNAFDASGKPVRAPAVTWTSDNEAVASVDDAIRVINTNAVGQAHLHCETFDKKITSNSVKLEVVDIASIKLDPDNIELHAGSRRHLNATCLLTSGEEASDVALIWLESNSSVARVSASGMVFGFAEGTTDVTASDDHVSAENSVVVTVLPGETAGGSGSGYPRVLISDNDPDPDTGEPVILSPDDPPVHQRPHDVERNIWWINSASPLARLYLEGEFGPESREWRIYHIDRYIDVIVQISTSRGPDSEDQIGVGEWTARWGERAADIQGAAASGLVTFIREGVLPS
jgi:hypothetical protein